MKKTSLYELGKRHARDGVRALAHRNGRIYDSRRAQQSYTRGYHEGIKEYGFRRLDYSNPLNNRTMDGDAQ